MGGEIEKEMVGLYWGGGLAVAAKGDSDELFLKPILVAIAAWVGR